MNVIKSKLTTIFCSFIAVILFGCNSSGSSTKPSTEKQTLKPKADFVFNDSKRSKLLAERNQVIQSSKLTYDKAVYSVIYAMETDDDYILIMKSSVGNQELAVMAPLKPKANSSCSITKLSGTDKHSYTFDCSSGQVSKNQDLTTYNGKYIGKSPSTIADSPDLILELQDGIGSMGSTKLKLDLVGSTATITTQNPFAVYFGIDSTDLGVTTYSQLETVVNQSGGRETTLVFDTEINGSSDDEINMYTGLLIHDKGINTKVSKTGSVFSGGTDLFTAGKSRTLELKNPNVPVEKNKQVGVHSWAEKDSSGKIVSATSIPYTNDSHRAQATYFQRMLGDKGIDFYLFTLRSAPVNGEHHMTRSELQSYQVTTSIQ
ncbi:hypothetical protein [Vibrio bivalvicida]|uniref:Uncharacterized protein n=1 Tax=Vibrio bivalvicida TaxID=1276888 RepID=A0A177XXH8_9VIBR|nr:hypothetical protein [Vibrio bivalvicida]OAJ93298.1 hypothetical protein APB76_15160 [Vibrio bivalvicida]